MNERDIGVSVGDQASLTMQVTQQHIDDFAGLCGDRHPMHRDPDYAAKTRFGKTVAHGVTPLALVSAVLGTQVGGPDVTVVQLGQTARFSATGLRRGHHHGAVRSDESQRRAADRHPGLLMHQPRRRPGDDRRDDGDAGPDAFREEQAILSVLPPKGEWLQRFH